MLSATRRTELSIGDPSAGQAPAQASRRGLALRGGPPTFPAGPPGWPIMDDDVRQALEHAWRDGDWGRYHGQYCNRLCDELAAYHGVEHVALCCSGTFAVELALRGLGVSADDEVLLAGYDFPGNFRAIEAIGAVPVLVDLDAANWNLDVAAIDAAVGPRTKAIIASHLHGGCVPVRALVAAAERHGLAVVEDSCQCPGAIINGRRAGTWGDAGVISFGGSKLLTAGRGGAVFTRRDDVRQRMKVYCERGNHAFPLSELQAAVLLPQLQKLDQRNAARSAAASRLITALSDIHWLRPLTNAPTTEPTQPSYYKLGFQFIGDGSTATRDDFAAVARAEGIALDAGFHGFARRSDRRCRRPAPLAQADAAAAGMLVLHHPVLLEPIETIDRLAAGIHKIASG